MCHILKGIGTSCCPSMVTGDLFRSKSDKRAFFLKKKNKIKKEVWIKKKIDPNHSSVPQSVLALLF